jgi:hypothetical protein
MPSADEPTTSYSLLPDGTIRILGEVSMDLKPMNSLGSIINRFTQPNNTPVLITLPDRRRFIGSADHRWENNDEFNVFQAQINRSGQTKHYVHRLSLGRFTEKISAAGEDHNIKIEATNFRSKPDGKSYVDLHYTNTQHSYFSECDEKLIPAGTPMDLTLCVVEI